MERGRGLNLCQGVQNEWMIGAHQAIVRGMLLAVPSAPAATTCAHLGSLARVGWTGVKPVAFTKGVCRNRAAPHDALVVVPPQDTDCLVMMSCIIKSSSATFADGRRRPPRRWSGSNGFSLACLGHAFALSPRRRTYFRGAAATWRDGPQTIEFPGSRPSSTRRACNDSSIACGVAMRNASC